MQQKNLAAIRNLTDGEITMKKKSISYGLIIDDFTSFLPALKKEQTRTDKDEDPGVDYAVEYRKQTGKDLETGEYVTQ